MIMIQIPEEWGGNLNVISGDSDVDSSCYLGICGMIEGQIQTLYLWLGCCRNNKVIASSPAVTIIASPPAIVVKPKNKTAYIIKVTGIIK